MSPRTNMTGLSRPDFILDPGSADRNAGRKIDWDQVPGENREVPGQDVTVDAIYAVGATSVGLTAGLAEDVPSGSRFTLAAGTKTFRTSADAVKGATTLTVEPLAEATAAGEVYTFEGSGSKTVAHGTPMAEAASGLIYPAADVVAGNAGEAVGLLEGPAVQDAAEDRVGYGLVVGGVVYATLLPGLTTNMRAALKENGTGFRFEDYTDDRAS